MKKTIRTLLALLICVATILCTVSCDFSGGEKGNYVELTEENKAAKLTELSGKIADGAVVGKETEAKEGEDTIITRELGAVLSMAIGADIKINDVAIKAALDEKLTMASNVVSKKGLLSNEVTDSSLNAKVESKYTLSTKATEAALKDLCEKEAIKDVKGLAEFLANKKGSLETTVTLLDGKLFIDSTNKFDQINLFDGKVAADLNVLFADDEKDSNDQGGESKEEAGTTLDFGIATAKTVDNVFDILNSADVLGNEGGLAGIIAAIEKEGFNVYVDTEKMLIKIEAGDDFKEQVKKWVEEEEGTFTSFDIKKLNLILKFNENGNLIRADLDANLKMDIEVNGLHIAGNFTADVSLEVGDIPTIKAPDIKKYTDITPLLPYFNRYN